MTDEEMLNKLNQLKQEEVRALMGLVIPARAAANQMEDAGMKNGASQLKEALFKYDAAHQQFEAVIAENQAQAIQVMMNAIKGLSS